MSRFNEPAKCPQCGNTMATSELGNLCVHCGESSEVNQELWNMGNSAIVEWSNRFLELASRLQPFIDEIVESLRNDSNTDEDLALFQIVSNPPEPFADWEIPKVAQCLMPVPSQDVGDNHQETYIRYLAATVVTGALNQWATSSSEEPNNRISPSRDVVFEPDWLEHNSTYEVAESYVHNWRALISKLSDEHRSLAVRMMQGDASIMNEPDLTFLEFVQQLSSHRRR